MAQFAEGRYARAAAHPRLHVIRGLEGHLRLGVTRRQTQNLARGPLPVLRILQGAQQEPPCHQIFAIAAQQLCQQPARLDEIPAPQGRLGELHLALRFEQYRHTTSQTTSI